MYLTKSTQGVLFKIILFISFSVLSIVASAQNTWQYWDEVEIKYPISSAATLGFTWEQRVTDNIGTFALHNYGFALQYTFNDYFRIKVNYLYEREKEKEWHTENRIEIIPRISLDLKHGWGCSTNPRFEYRIFKEIEYWRWRQRFEIKKLVSIYDCNFTPYLSYEWFYVFHTHTLNQNWYTVGISKTIKSQLDVTLYYRMVSKKTFDGWQNYNAFGTTFSYLFNRNTR
ncbi:DUF2490 domain-containing protein [uncultured Pontibacter sp.]|uniref:DUF2490 domain-containing protein n=1 Tax=uncultured Pontibacter sp. TaxID=453356 RepID=UPI002636E71E|nr:DUF2490 domain-containing protein [uncultured Pontibacter sp.]